MKNFGIISSVMILTTSSAVVSVSLDILSPQNDTCIVAKTVFSSNMRMVLAVGVEGTGHDYILQVNDHMFDTDGQLARIPKKDMVEAGIYHIGNLMGINARHYSVALDSAKKRMRNLATLGEELPFPGTMALMHGKYSYPDGFGPNKVLKYLDLRILAEVAEEEGVDFRVLYLRRSAKDMLIANTIHRGFQDALGDKDTTTPEQRYMEYMQILLTDIAVVHSFLAELDPAFVVCHDFHRVGDIEQAAMVADFLAPNSEVAEPLQASFVAVAKAHGASTESLLFDGADVIESRLQRKLDAFESALCAGR